MTDGSPKPRRAVVDLANCNLCHDRLVLHGGQRFNVEECVMCHNPNASDKARRTADTAPEESIDFKRMIHRIHTGENLTQDYTIYGFGTPPSVNNFNEVRFPGDRRDCATCHAERHLEHRGNRSAGNAADDDAARLVHAAAPHGGGLPGVPRFPGRGVPRVHQHGALRGGLRRVPRGQRGLGGRKGPRALGPSGWPRRFRKE